MLMLKGIFPILGPHLENRPVEEKMEKNRRFNSIFIYLHVILHLDSLKLTYHSSTRILQHSQFQASFSEEIGNVSI